MTLPLTPDMLHGAYEYLRTTPPFRGWKLPEADEIEFRVITSRDQGWYDRKDGQHIIAISARRVGHSIRLLTVKAHEMIHLYQRIGGTETANTEHNAEFRRLANQACRYHGFDPKEF